MRRGPEDPPSLWLIAIVVLGAVLAAVSYPAKLGRVRICGIGRLG